VPEKSSIPLYWRKQEQTYSLIGSVCVSCNKKHFPQKPICECGSPTTKQSLTGIGEIISFTTIHTPPLGFESPYHIALIKLEQGPVIPAQIQGTPQIGSKVRPIFRRLSAPEKGVINYGLKFKII
jgi:hypothetical protein